ncbi:uncharacterized protein [Rutidosis leptorrhynchoides]|uniref:uncharacterized protein n=1 Tax=Rutidosis leptorrhynchoides TaxID=125765 RepID=UPI003A99DB20
MEGDSNAVKSSGGTVASYLNDESTPLIQNAKVSTEIDYKPYHLGAILVLVFQCLVLALTVHGKKETPFEANTFLMNSIVWKFLVFGLTSVVVYADHNIITLTSKSGARPILMGVIRFFCIVAHLCLISIMIMELIGSSKG